MNIFHLILQVRVLELGGGGSILPIFPEIVTDGKQWRLGGLSPKSRLCGLHLLSSTT